MRICKSISMHVLDTRTGIVLRGLDSIANLLIEMFFKVIKDSFDYTAGKINSKPSVAIIKTGLSAIKRFRLIVNKSKYLHKV